MSCGQIREQNLTPIFWQSFGAVLISGISSGFYRLYGTQWWHILLHLFQYRLNVHRKTGVLFLKSANQLHLIKYLYLICLRMRPCGALQTISNTLLTPSSQLKMILKFFTPLAGRGQTLDVGNSKKKSQNKWQVINWTTCTAWAVMFTVVGTKKPDWEILLSGSGGCNKTYKSDKWRQYKHPRVLT